MENKVIHYCWFGGNPLSKLTKRCIKSWKKYLPDYEIIEWNESNIDLEECPFIKEAYKNKKWAFVADYARTKVINKMGGIYLDTDVIITKDISKFLEKGTVLGLEDSLMVNAAVWIENKPNSWFSKEMLKFYQSQESFNPDDLYSVSIPRIMNSILYKLDLNVRSKEIQHLKHDITVVPRDYFYPLSYNYRNNVFTENTCMIHYFDATWIPKWEQRENKIYRRFGEKNGDRVIKSLRFTKRNVKRGAKLVLYPAVVYRRYKNKITPKYLEQINNFINELDNFKDSYIIMHNPEWFGVTNATIELFDNHIGCGEILRKKDIKAIGDKIIENNINQVLFSAMCIGWIDLAKYLKSKKPDIKIKVFWHGNHSQVTEPYGWARNLEIIKYHKLGIIDVFATCKESLIEFYKSEGYKTLFITNSVNVNVKPDKKKNKDEFRIGLYAAKSDDWRKNMFSQLAAAKFLNYKNVVIDMVPLNNDAISFAKDMGIKIDGLNKPIPREDLIKRMGANDINLYVTFSECSPMAPIESFSVGVPCIVGNNHHCFKDSKLKDYLIVNNEASPKTIASTIKKCMDHKEEVLKLYKEWNKENKIESKESVKRFLEM